MHGKSRLVGLPIKKLHKTRCLLILRSQDSLHFFPDVAGFGTARSSIESGRKRRPRQAKQFTRARNHVPSHDAKKCWKCSAGALLKGIIVQASFLFSPLVCVTLCDIRVSCISIPAIVVCSTWSKVMKCWIQPFTIVEHQTGDDLYHSPLLFGCFSTCLIIRGFMLNLSGWLIIQRFRNIVVIPLISHYFPAVDCYWTTNSQSSPSYWMIMAMVVAASCNNLQLDTLW